jgi:hypothetical protein
MEASIAKVPSFGALEYTKGSEGAFASNLTITLNDSVMYFIVIGTAILTLMILILKGWALDRGSQTSVSGFIFIVTNEPK